MVTGQRHLITCTCVLRHLLTSPDPPLHQFPVFSVIEDDVVLTKYVQCPNCGVVHKVTGLLKSEIVRGKEDLSATVKIDDIRTSIHPSIVAVLETNDCDLSVWEYVSFVIEHKQWGEIVPLSSETVGDERHVKYIKILGDSIFKVGVNIRQERIMNP